MQLHARLATPAQPLAAASRFDITHCLFASDGDDAAFIFVDEGAGRQGAGGDCVQQRSPAVRRRCIHQHDLGRAVLAQSHREFEAASAAAARRIRCGRRASSARVGPPSVLGRFAGRITGRFTGRLAWLEVLASARKVAGKRSRFQGKVIVRTDMAALHFGTVFQVE